MQDELSIEKARVAILAEERNQLLRVVEKLQEQVAAQHGVQRTVEACPDDRHDYYKWFLNYVFCPYCGERLHSR